MSAIWPPPEGLEQRELIRVRVLCGPLPITVSLYSRDAERPWAPEHERAGWEITADIAKGAGQEDVRRGVAESLRQLANLVQQSNDDEWRSR